MEDSGPGGQTARRRRLDRLCPEYQLAAHPAVVAEEIDLLLLVYLFLLLEMALSKFY